MNGKVTEQFCDRNAPVFQLCSSCDLTPGLFTYTALFQNRCWLLKDIFFYTGTAFLGTRTAKEKKKKCVKDMKFL